MDVRSMESALTLVSGELAGTEKEFEQLKVRRERLLAIKMNLEALLFDHDLKTIGTVAVSASITPRHEFVDPAEVAANRKPTWQIVRDAFPRGGGTLTVPEIHKIVNANGPVIANPDAIRISMRRHPEVFKNDNGRFSLWNPEPLREGVFAIAEEATEVAS